jgi:tetratricopeptide (TPR) repeat protein
MGEAHRDLGQLEPAMQAFAKARHEFEELARLAPGNNEISRQVAETRNAIADVLVARKKFDDALVEYRAARELIVAVAAADRNNAELQAAVAYSARRIGDAYHVMQRHADALTSYRSAAEILETLLVPDPRNVSRLDELFVIHEQIAIAVTAKGDAGAAAEAHRAWLEVAKRRANVDPDDRNSRWQIARVYHSLGWRYYEGARYEQALETARAALEIGLALIEKERTNPDRVLALGSYHALHGEVLLAAKRPRDALVEYEAVIGLAREYEAMVKTAEARYTFADVHSRIGDAHTALGDKPRALEHYRAASAVVERELELEPTQATLLGLRKELRQKLR